MTLQERILLVSRLGEYMLSEDAEWLAAREKAVRMNPWFMPEFIDLAVNNLANLFLTAEKLTGWAEQYAIPAENALPKTVGLVMAGNIPLVGFHDFLSIWIAGHRQRIKTSTKDEVLIKHLVEKMTVWNPETAAWVSFEDRLNGCDAYIATGSNNTGRYFDYYFGKYPHIIRRNRTSVAVLDGTETPEELDALTDDIQLYFGLGCRNITQLFVPRNYDFIPLLGALKKYEYFMDHHKYKHNFDYHLALLIMGTKYYMNNDSVVLTENVSPFSPVSQVHYQYYESREIVAALLHGNPDIQCVVGHGYLPFGQAQQPSLTDYADGVDTMDFLRKL
jgi:hypothetical protein